MSMGGFAERARASRLRQIAEENKKELFKKLEVEMRLYERHKENAAFVTLHEADIKQRLYLEDNDRYYKFKDMTITEIASTFYAELNM